MGTVRQSPVQKNAERSKGIFAFFIHISSFLTIYLSSSLPLVVLWYYTSLHYSQITVIYIFCR